MNLVQLLQEISDPVAYLEQRINQIRDMTASTDVIEKCTLIQSLLLVFQDDRYWSQITIFQSMTNSLHTWLFDAVLFPNQNTHKYISDFCFFVV